MTYHYLTLWDERCWGDISYDDDDEYTAKTNTKVKHGTRSCMAKDGDKNE